MSCASSFRIYVALQNPKRAAWGGLEMCFAIAGVVPGPDVTVGFRNPAEVTIFATNSNFMDDFVSWLIKLLRVTNQVQSHVP